MKRLGYGVKMEKTILLALKAKQKKDYQKISEELSENVLEAEETLTNNLSDWFTSLTDNIIDSISFDDLNTYGVAIARPIIEEKVADAEEDYKIIIGEQVIKTFNTTSEKVDEQLIIKENGLIIDTLINYDNLNVAPVNNISPSPVTSKKSIDNIQSSYKKKIAHTIQTVLDKFFPKPSKNTQTSLDTFTPYGATPRMDSNSTSFINDIINSITEGVHNTLTTPELLFNRIPNQTVLDYLESRVFEASPQTLARVTDKIYNIISKEAEQEGKHPYEIAQTLKEQFNQLKTYEAKRIARTEVLRSKNEANWQRLNNNETVELVQWVIGVEDDNSREEHVAQNLMITYIGNQFPNGQRYPYDENSEPGDYINCRCGLEAYYPDIRYSPPEGAEYWFEEDMIYSNEVDMGGFNVIFVED